MGNVVERNTVKRIKKARLYWRSRQQYIYIFFPSLFFPNSAHSLVLVLQGDVGLIPRICEGLFTRITGMTRRDEASFRTEVRWVEWRSESKPYRSSMKNKSLRMNKNKEYNGMGMWKNLPNCRWAWISARYLKRTLSTHSIVDLQMFNDLVFRCSCR